MVSFGRGRRCGATSMVEQEASTQATAMAGKMPTARSAILPRMVPLITIVPQASTDASNS